MFYNSFNGIARSVVEEVEWTDDLEETIGSHKTIDEECVSQEVHAAYAACVIASRPPVTPEQNRFVGMIRAEVPRPQTAAPTAEVLTELDKLVDIVAATRIPTLEECSNQLSLKHYRHLAKESDVVKLANGVYVYKKGPFAVDQLSPSQWLLRNNKWLPKAVDVYSSDKKSTLALKASDCIDNYDSVKMAQIHAQIAESVKKNPVSKPPGYAQQVYERYTRPPVSNVPKPHVDPPKHLRAAVDPPQHSSKLPESAPAPRDAYLSVVKIEQQVQYEKAKKSQTTHWNDIVAALKRAQASSHINDEENETREPTLVSYIDDDGIATERTRAW